MSKGIDPVCCVQPEMDRFVRVLFLVRLCVCVYVLVQEIGEFLPTRVVSAGQVKEYIVEGGEK